MLAKFKDKARGKTQGRWGIVGCVTPLPPKKKILEPSIAVGQSEELVGQLFHDLAN